jgi:ATP-binding cassette subfamily A (ABC1) protein 3
VHFWALFLKRCRYFKRDVRGLLCEILLPCIIVVCGLAIMTTTFLIESPSLAITPSSLGYDLPIHVLYSGDASKNDMETITDAFN